MDQRMAALEKPNNELEKTTSELQKDLAYIKENMLTLVKFRALFMECLTSSTNTKMGSSVKEEESPVNKKTPTAEEEFQGFETGGEELPCSGLKKVELPTFEGNDPDEDGFEGPVEEVSSAIARTEKVPVFEMCIETETTKSVETVARGRQGASLSNSSETQLSRFPTNPFRPSEPSNAVRGAVPPLPAVSMKKRRQVLKALDESLPPPEPPDTSALRTILPRSVLPPKPPDFDASVNGDGSWAKLPPMKHSDPTHISDPCPGSMSPPLTHSPPPSSWTASLVSTGVLPIEAKAVLLEKRRRIRVEWKFCGLGSVRDLLGLAQFKGNVRRDLTPHLLLMGLSPNRLFWNQMNSSISFGAKIHTQTRKLGLTANNIKVGTALIDLDAKCGRVDSARLVFDQMGVRNLVSWNTVIDGYMRNCDIEDTRNLFDELPVKNAISWTVRNGGFVKKDYHEQALIECFRGMQLAGVAPDYVIVIAISVACANLGARGLGKMGLILDLRAQAQRKVSLMGNDFAARAEIEFVELAQKQRQNEMFLFNQVGIVVDLMDQFGFESLPAKHIADGGLASLQKDASDHSTMAFHNVCTWWDTHESRGLKAGHQAQSSLESSEFPILNYAKEVLSEFKTTTFSFMQWDPGGKNFVE